MKLLIEYLKPYKWFIAITLTIKTAATLIELVIPSLLGKILDLVDPNNTSGHVVSINDTKTILIFGAIMIVCALLACVGNITANRMAAKLARNSTKKIRHTLFERIMLLSPRQVDKFTIPSLESRLTSDTYHIQIGRAHV